MHSRSNNGLSWVIGAGIGASLLGGVGFLGGGVTLLALAAVLAATPTFGPAPVPLVNQTAGFTAPSGPHTVRASAPAVQTAPTRRAVRTGVVINGRELTSNEAAQFTRAYGMAPQPGSWWYDSRSGQFGRVGEGVSGLVGPGEDFGRLASNASRGRSGVYLNGRQLPWGEVSMYASVLGPIQPGRYWLDSQGNVGHEGQGAVANLLVASGGHRGGSPADKWLTGAEWSGGLTGGTVDVSGGGNSVYSVGGEVLTLPY